MGAAGSLMSGSGPSVFGLFEDQEKHTGPLQSGKQYKHIWLVTTCSAVPPVLNTNV